MNPIGVTIQNSQKVLNKTLRVVISYSEDDKVYYASVPSIEGCMTYGDTVEEAMKYIREAAEAMVEVMMEEGWEIPDDSQNIEYNMPIHLAIQPA